ncbi:hypothetical protein FV226_24725 [Methylobacterium sp. WL12]|uniref:hypothetical protein n=1 Tax=Methylobacterium sp. WL12 TaxID=2603890 RepID=UPI0011CB397E|nr:hypothetical protein [Methylobacterium sp. WL12]TXM65644.1 hypothetical protein FV226_24725 [Methylobacterium sp. WL12]TXN13949.1 hypothetical protein FV219_04120 [Methylobacterium sp. WL122]
MSSNTQRCTVHAREDGKDAEPGDAWRSSSKWAADVKSGEKVVSLFSEPSLPGPQERSDEPAVVDWPGALDLIRDVGTRVRRARDFAQEVSLRSQSIIQRSVKQTEDAERRAQTAEAAAKAAMLRAERADELARLSEARAKLAEKQAKEARAAEAEAQLWLQRVHACLKNELGDIVVDLS